MLGTILIGTGSIIIGLVMIWRAVSGETRKGYRY